MDARTGARARELFFQYQGSRFYMSRDGVDREYDALAVPSELEAEWLLDLKSSWLARLAAGSSSEVVSLLSHHGDYANVSLVMAAPRSGSLTARLNFVEQAQTYVQGAADRGLATEAEVKALNIEHETLIRAIRDTRVRVAPASPPRDRDRNEA